MVHASQETPRDADTPVGTTVGDHPLPSEALLLFASAAGAATRLASEPWVPGVGASGDGTALSDNAIRREGRWLQREVGAGFRVRFADNPVGRARGKEILLGTRDADLVDDTGAFAALIEREAHRAWFATLPRNEGARGARLQAITAEAARRFGVDH